MGLCSVKWCQGQSVNDEVGVKWVVSGEVMAVEFRQNVYNVNNLNQKTKKRNFVIMIMQWFLIYFQLYVTRGRNILNAQYVIILIQPAGRQGRACASV